ncbi:MAG TPA: MobA-like NTP transferase domain containing protein [Syntrophobacteraceae bacterium]|nr:MobA-like NTP transferase domain containing protein [Syntrophobacteraceae bacterium]
MTITSSLDAIASIILAAGKGSRMLGYEGNKTLLPLLPGSSPYSGDRPMLLEVLDNLPHGPKGIVVHHFAEAVRTATQHLQVSYLLQPVTNGTGGAVLTARTLLQTVSCDRVIITMGDVPLISPATYQNLLRGLDANHLMVLAFEAADRGQYGMLETVGDQVERITEWKYWREYPAERQARLRWCNAGVYAARRATLGTYLERLARRPHHVKKRRDDQWVTVEEYFLTDLVELLTLDGLGVGLAMAAEEEVMGVDTPEALIRAQAVYALRRKNVPGGET